MSDAEQLDDLLARLERLRVVLVAEFGYGDITTVMLTTILNRARQVRRERQAA